MEFEVADAEALPYANDSFDIVTSTFGAMFTPDHERPAREMLRVCQSQGKIGLANWTPEGMWGQLFALHARYLPPPPGLRPPPLWGTETRLRELFGTDLRDLRVRRRTTAFRSPSAQRWFEFFQTYFGPTIKVLEALDESGQRQFANDVVAVLDGCNRAEDGTLVAEAEYLEVIAVKV
jgi:hypothetical protein